MRRERRRDEGLELLSKGTRFLAAGAFVAVGVFSAAVAKGLPGHSAAPARTVTPATTAPTTVAPSDYGASSQTVAPPTTPPQTTYQPPVVSSGGS